MPLWFSVVSAVATGDLGAPDVLVADPVEQAVDFEPPRFLRMVRVRFRLRSEDPNLLNWVASEWHSPGDTAVRTAAIWATGGGRVQGPAVRGLEEVDRLAVLVNDEMDPRRHLDELAIVGGDATEVP